jgi:cytochrome P450
MLREQSPVFWLERHKAWLLLDHDRVRAALSDEALSTDTITPLEQRLDVDQRARFAPAAALLRDWMIFNDPPVHTALRAPVRASFTPRGVEKLTGAIEEHTDALLRQADLDGDGTVDLVAAVAYPLPATVIAILLGVPVERHDEFRQLSRHLGSLVMGKVSRSDAWDRALLAAEAFHALFGELIERYRREPADNMISRMIVAADSEESVLTADQLVGACSLLLFGGHETTTGLIGNGVVTLLDRPAARRRLRDDPELGAAAVEELLRFDGPSKIVVRRARAGGDWNGVPLREGQAVFCCLTAANRDPEHFEHPHELVVDRTPNHHLAFGWGRHVCLGAQLARLEARVVIPRFLARFPDAKLACAPDELEYQPTIVGRTLRELPITLGRAAAA